MDKIKEAFLKVRGDINILKSELGEIKERLDNFLTNFNENERQKASTEKAINQTPLANSSTHLYPFKPLKGQILGISTGNEGVSTDRQTDRQTDKQQDEVKNLKEKAIFSKEELLNNEDFFPIVKKEEREFENPIDKATELLNSLDSIKKEIRIKFKRLTNQEMIVFSAIYQLEEERGKVTYSDLSKTLKLSESSIRDYVQRLIKKGIPVEKKKINNKNILLGISQNLKKMTHLTTILKLRDL
jgi:hypothetical protein